MNTLEEPASIEQLRQLARRRLPQQVFDFIDGGADDELALRRNRHELQSAPLVGRALVNVTSIDTTCTIFGKPLAAPLVVAPMGACGLAWPRADVEIARAAASVGIPYVLSTFANTGIEDLADAAEGRLWFQLYPLRDRALRHGLVHRARVAGYEVLVVTVDVPVPGNRERDHSHSRSSLTGLVKNVAGLIWRPRWCWGIACHGLPRFPNAAAGAGAAALAQRAGAQVDATFDWDELARVRDRWPGTLVVKGIQHTNDVQRLASLGMDGIWLSNHGGRQLDAAPGPLSLLQSVTQIQRGHSILIADSGFRRGSEVFKALISGADAVALGRSVLYGAAVAGRAGALHALQIIQRELVQTMAMCGVTHIPAVTSPPCQPTP